MLEGIWYLRISHGYFSIIWVDNKNASEIIESHLPLKKSYFVVFTVPAGGLALLVSITLAGKMINMFWEPFYYKDAILAIIKMRISWWSCLYDGNHRAEIFVSPSIHCHTFEVSAHNNPLIRLTWNFGLPRPDQLLVTLYWIPIPPPPPPSLNPWQDMHLLMTC